MNETAYCVRDDVWTFLPPLFGSVNWVSVVIFYKSTHPLAFTSSTIRGTGSATCGVGSSPRSTARNTVKSTSWNCCTVARGREMSDRTSHAQQRLHMQRPQPHSLHPATPGRWYVPQNSPLHHPAPLLAVADHSLSPLQNTHTHTHSGIRKPLTSVHWKRTFRE